ncbi:MAG: dienelactone hydrolase family protein [Acidobacteriia bacterium]|nr:dienelactone hydrolase family protein [Terriglobia bacterium]MYG02351.1 dienelactone hydrolase family protein [Terriglobia bacterium]MYK12454.1 dienelactone hydrolase family protein [Terriglobia bacterium]
MCDERTAFDNDAYLSAKELTRRQFGAGSAGAGLAVLLTRTASAQAVSESDVEVETPDGVADCYFVHPSAGSHPGVLIWPDAFGLRPAMKRMAKRLAESGYSVLVVNQYYRSQRAPIVNSTNFAEVRDTVRPLMASLNPSTHMTDAKAFVSFLDSQPSVDGTRKMGTMGYCMGGPITMRTAAAVPDRIGAGASFHGGGLVTDRPDSPHLLVPKMTAHYLFAIAENDDTRQPEAKDVLRDAFAQAGLPAEIEVYGGAMHGWCPPDTQVYHETQAERAWSRLLALFERALG